MKNMDTSLTVYYLLKGLSWYFFLVDLLLKNVQCFAVWKNSLKARRYAARLIDLNEYLASFPGVTIADKLGITELNEILLHSMPNSWSKQAHVQVFDYDYISFKDP